MIGLQGKRALVTGGSRGIGAAVAELLAEYGCDVVIGYRSRARAAEAVVASLRQKYGVKAIAHAADLTTMGGADELVQRTTSELGGLDFLVGSAGTWPSEEVPLSDMSDDRWRRSMSENVDSVFYSTRAAARAIADNGRIVLVSSTAGQRGEAMHADYGAAKGAVISLVKSLALELGSRGITVNSVAPGWVDTEMCAAAMADGGRERIAATIPIGRVASPSDVAGPIVFLCSGLARHITGEIVNVNGGSVLCG